MTQGSAWVGVIAGVKAERRTAKARVIHEVIQGQGEGAQVESGGIQAEGVVSAIVSATNYVGVE